MYARISLIVVGDAGATANNLVAQEMLFRSGIVGSLITQLIHIAVVLILYKLFKSVNKDHAVLLVVLGLVGVPISMLNTLNRVAALMLASGADYLSVFTTDQLQALSLFFLNLNEQGMFIATIFWGLWLFPLGLLIKKSGFFPKIIGTLVMIGGIGYTSEPFIRYLIPSSAASVVPIVLIMTMGEIVFMGWITLKGAKLPLTKSRN
jgi:hypothetical protein